MNKKLYRLWRQMTADKKRFGVMATLMAVGLLLWARLILLQDVPRVATADPDPGEQQPAQGPAAAGQERPTVEVWIPDQLALDLFALRPDRYNPNPDFNTSGPNVQADDPRADDWLRRESLLDEARGMTLQGIIQDARPFAVIDGVRVYVGDTVGGFVLIALDDRQRLVKLQSQSIQDLVVNLRMSDG